MDIKDWVREARKKGGLTLERLGEVVGRTKANVHAWEKGSHEPSITQFLRIARVTKMNPAELDDWPEDLRVLTGAAGDDEGANLNAWPLPPELLAALQNADPKTLRRAQTALMSALDIDMVPAASVSETAGTAA